MQRTDSNLVWLDGKLVPYESATIHINSPAARYGLGLFEGLRGYWNATERQLYVFRAHDHYRRMLQSAKIMRFDHGRSLEDLAAALLEMLRANGYREDVHIRHSFFLGGDGQSTDTAPIIECVLAGRMGRAESARTGIQVGVSSWTRIDDRDMPPRVKATANYLNTRLARLWAQKDGYDEAILLNRSGQVAEAPAACVLVVRDGRLLSPPVTAGSLDSITRATLIELARDVLGLAVAERPIDRTELYVADEIMIVGSRAEITPVVGVDRMPVQDGVPGPVTRALMQLYLRVVRGEEARYRHWLLPVYGEGA